MQNQACCFTGHRDIPVSQKPALQKRLEEETARLIHQGVAMFLAGGALGFDTMAALALNAQNKMNMVWLIFDFLQPFFYHLIGIPRAATQGRPYNIAKQHGSVLHADRDEICTIRGIVEPRARG